MYDFLADARNRGVLVILSRSGPQIAAIRLAASEAAIANDCMHTLEFDACSPHGASDVTITFRNHPPVMPAVH